MLESRANYGYYGVFGGASGENEPKPPHKSGWSFDYYYFKVKEAVCVLTYKIKAMDEEHALKQIKQHCKKHGYELLGRCD